MNFNITKTVAALAAATAALALGGCGGAPGDTEVHEAMMRQLEAVAGKAGARTQKADIDKVKVVSCAKAEPAGYRCDWTGPMGSGSGRLVKSDSGWALVGV